MADAHGRHLGGALEALGIDVTGGARGLVAGAGLEALGEGAGGDGTVDGTYTFALLSVNFQKYLALMTNVH